MADTERDDDATDAPQERRTQPAPGLPAVPLDEEAKGLPPGATEAPLPVLGDDADQPALPAAEPADEAQQAGGAGEASETETAEADETGEGVDPSIDLPRFVLPDRKGPQEQASAERELAPAAEQPVVGQERRAERGRRAQPPSSSVAGDSPAEIAPRQGAGGGADSLVVGDPLLTGPTPIVKRDEGPPSGAAPSARTSPATAPSREGESTVSPTTGPTGRPASPPDSNGDEQSSPHGVPRVSTPPPPPPTATPPRPTPDTRTQSPRIGGVPVPDGSGPLARPGRPARRGARGASIATQPTTPARRPRRVDETGPTPTLRATTVAPVPRLVGRRPRVRRVTRVVRHVDPWSVFKVAAVFSLAAYVIGLVAGVLLWNVAYSTGTIDNIERGMETTGWTTFELKGGEIFHNAWIGGLFAAVGLTGLAVLVATLFNLITDLVGGLRFTVLEEEVVERTASPMRRFATRRSDGPPRP